MKNQPAGLGFSNWGAGWIWLVDIGYDVVDNLKTLKKHSEMWDWKGLSVRTKMVECKVPPRLKVLLHGHFFRKNPYWEDSPGTADSMAEEFPVVGLFESARVAQLEV